MDCTSIITIKGRLALVTVFFLQMLDLKASAVELLEVMLEDTHVDTIKRAKVSLHLYNSFRSSQVE